MSRNRKQSNKTNATANKKTEADALKNNIQDVQASVKDKVDDLKKEAQAKQPQTTSSTVKTEAAKAEATASTAKTDTKTGADNAVKDTAEKQTTAKQTTAGKSAVKSGEPKKTEAGKANQANSNKKAEPPKKTTAPQPQLRKDKQQINYAPSEKKSGGGMLAGLALLLGVAGTGLGAYSFNELRTLKAGVGSDVEAKISGLDGKIAELAKADPAAAVKGQLDELGSRQKAFAAAEERFNQRIAAVEQMQKGLSQSVKQDIDTALSAKMGAVDSLLAKVKDIELGQKGLTKNLSESNAAASAVNVVAMQQQEVGYLLRMADYKLQSEGDVLGASGLLKVAESKLLATNEGKADALVDAVREKIIQLSGVKPIDTNALVGQLKSISGDVANLQAKPTSAEKAAEPSAEKTDDNALGKLTAIIASGVKYTPKDPSKIDVSAETVLIEKRLMQADIKTAELAVQSHNKVLLASSVQSMNDSLDKFFADDATAKSIRKALAAVSQSELETVMPDLSGLVKQFEATQAQ